jgi:hypothetical protein
MNVRAGGTFELVIERDRVEPGEAIRGSVTPATPVWAVDLVRVETAPCATLEFTVVSARPSADGGFALSVPEEAPPSVTGTECALAWRVRVRTSEWPQHSDPRESLEIVCRS